MKVDKEAVLEAISGNRKALKELFLWCFFPRGREYWKGQYVSESPLDVAALKEIIRESDTSKLWRDMTDAEKGALLLAHHDGKVIEAKSLTNWYECANVMWDDDCAYRVKPEPVRETVGLYAGLDRKRYPLPIGTIDLIDGVPDRASIKLGEI